MLVSLTARDLLLASWRVPAQLVQGSLPRGLEPVRVDGERALLSIAAFRNTDVRVNGRRAPSYSQINIRTYVTRGEEEAVCFLSLRVTSAGLGGVFFGVPFRPARIRLGAGGVRAPGLGLTFRYQPSEQPVEVPLLHGVRLGSHDVGYFMAAGLRRIVAEHDPFRWVPAELLAPPRLDPLLALGFDVREPDSLLYAESTAFRVRLPAQKVP